MVAGKCRIGDTEVMLIVLDFGFMGGTMGSVVGEKISVAFENAARRGIPAVVVVTGGGVRIQEGVLSLMQMAKTVTAANRLRAVTVFAICRSYTTGVCSAKSRSATLPLT